MLVASGWLRPRRSRSIVGVPGIMALFLSAQAHAGTMLTPDMMPLRQVRPGMKGYGLSTFRGTTISRFDVEVVGVIKKVNNGRDLIMIRITSGPVVRRGANLVQGMSGSPIYVQGRLIGALSQGEANMKEPLNLVTPIEDMLDAWDPNIPQKPAYFLPADRTPASEEDRARTRPDPRERRDVRARVWRPDYRTRVITLDRPIETGGRRITRLVLNAPLETSQRSSQDTAVMHRATTYLSVTGLREPLRTWFQKELDRLGYAVTVSQGPGIGTGKFEGAPLKPGAAFGTFLATGDIQVGATGTVTYRRGNRLLGFGHPLFGLGATEAAVTSAYVIDILARNDVSHHIALAGPVVGTLNQDRDFSVSAELDRKPALIPFFVTVHNHTHRRSQTFRTYLFQHPELTPLLMRLVAQQAIRQAHNVPGDVMARVTTTIDAAEVGRISRTNTVFDAEAIASAAVQDLAEINAIVSSNPFYPLPIRGGSMTVEITAGHNTATIERIFLKQGRYEPGDNLEVGVVLKPYRREPVYRTLTLRIPGNTPSGRYQLIVRGGAPVVTRVGSLVISSMPQEPQPPPVSVKQMVARFRAQPLNTDLVARLVLNTVAPALEGERLTQLPPNLSALMRSERNSGVRLERDEVRVVLPAGYVVSGVQQLQVTIVRKNTQEPTGGAGGATPPPLNAPGGGLASPSNGNVRTQAFDDTTEDLAQSAQGPAEFAADYDAVTRRWIAALSGHIGPASDERTRARSSNAPEQEAPQSRSTGTLQGNTANTPQSTSPSEKPAAASNPADEKPVGRSLRVWRQTARNDLVPGSFHGTGIASNGELRLTPALRKLVSTPETYVWSLAPDPEGNLYAGTGTGGRILKITPDGRTTVLATLPVITIQSLLRSADGTLWAGSGVKGHLYRVMPDGTFGLMCALPEKYIMSLAEDSKGNLYIGPAGGNVYRLSREERAGQTVRALTPFLKTSADYILALAVDAQDNLYAGAGNEGILYRVTPDGKSTVLFSARENAITALAVDAQGNIYAGTGPRGLLYHITPDGKATMLFDRATAFFTAIRPAPDGTLYASTVNAVYHIRPAANPAATTVCPLANPKEVDFLSLAVLADGHVAVGTGNVGEIWTSRTEHPEGAVRQGTYESVVRDAGLISRWGTVRWSALAPDDAQLRIETRTGNVSEPDGTWSPWMEVQRDSSDPLQGTVVSPPGRFLQYRVVLKAGNGQAEPALREISFTYLPRNQAPRVTFQSPAGGERWARSQTLRWNATDPDGDTLTYQLFYSSDMGATWHSLPAGNPDAQKPEAGSGLPSLEQVQRQLDSTGMPEAQKRAYLESYRLRLAAATGEALRETSRSLDTQTLPDGTYLLKVIASDAVSNPTDALTAEAISEPFLIANAAPEIALERPAVVERSVMLEGRARQNLIAITAVQYRVNSGNWQAAIAKDGLFDSPREAFAVVTGPLPSGKQVIEIAVFNAAGTRHTEKVEVLIP
ncbi:MAG: hypothetical protein NZ557_05870 [Chthonomonadaceae bacterium]|nr:hypothetical protein [Chthonomonadaceae bacterium]